jgi:hypothetical protein
MSMHTLARVEAAGLIQYGSKQPGRFDELTIAKLVGLYMGFGVTFVTPTPDGPGIRYRPADWPRPKLPKGAIGGIPSHWRRSNTAK